MKFHCKTFHYLFGICGSAFVTSLLWAQSVPSTWSDPSQLGPYPVGQTTAVIKDPCRQGGITRTTWTGLDYGITPYIGLIKPNLGITLQNTYGRQWIVDIFYPADANSIGKMTPKANFFNISAATWEQNGIHTGYDSVPAANGMAFPLVVFSPGLEDDSSEYSSQGYYLASQGFIVAMQRFTPGDFDYPDWNGTFYQEEISPGQAQADAGRCVDLSQMIDLMLTRNQKPGDIFNDKIDPDKIASMGHSDGGFSALEVTTGLRVFFGNYVGVPADPRVKAVVAEDPSTWQVPYSQLQLLNVPTLLLASTANDGTFDVRPFAANQAVEDYRVRITNSIEANFQNDDCDLAGVLQAENIPPTYFVQCDPTQGTVPTTVSSPIIYEYSTAFLKQALNQDWRYSMYFNPETVYPMEDGLFQFFCTKGGNTPFNLTTCLEDGSAAQAAFVTDPANRPAFILDGTFNFWMSQPPLGGH